MHYIYCYTNKINQHKYVGQTNNLKRRVNEHKSCAFNSKASSYNDLIHRKIREYGIDNFKIEVLEKLYTDNITIVNQQEEFWIQEKQSFRGTGLGYNSTLGGGNRIESSILTNEEIQLLKREISEGISYLELEKKYNISTSFISAINHGVYFNDINITYPLYQYYNDDSDYDELIDLLLHSTYSLMDISKMLNLGYSTVKKINAGTLRKGIYPNYPIRRLSASEQRANNIKELLRQNYSDKDILNCIQVSTETIRRINLGIVYNDKNIIYPIRSL